MKGSGLDKILGRIDDLDSVNLGILVQRLAGERAMQETVFNTIQDGILVIDSEGVVQYANEAALDLIGLKTNDVGVTRLWKMVPDLAQSIAQDSAIGLGQKNGVISREVALSYPEQRIVRLYMVPFDTQLVPDGRGGFVIVLTDVTADKISLEERIEDERTSSILRLAAGVAHELGNPLNSLTIHLQLVERKLQQLGLGASGARLARSLEICQGEVDRLDGIITHFLEAVRPQKPELNELDLVPLIESVLKVQEAELKDRALDVDLSMEGEWSTILGDRGQIKQVFFNLIKNAMEAMQTSGQIRISIRSDESSVYVQLADSGQGIAEEAISRVFEAYYSTKKSGHGLGMLIVQRIMRAHGGQIHLESKQDVGTVISLQFPHPSRRTKLLGA
jgi:PAS domain S-box-containing protein